MLQRAVFGRNLFIMQLPLRSPMPSARLTSVRNLLHATPSNWRQLVQIAGTRRGPSSGRWSRAIGSCGPAPRAYALGAPTLLLRSLISPPAHRVRNPSVNISLVPCDHTRADRHRRGKGALRDPAIDRGSGQGGPGFYFWQPQEVVAATINHGGTSDLRSRPQRLRPNGRRPRG